MLIRYIVKSVIFPGGTFVMNVIMKNEFGKYLIIALHLIEKISINNNEKFNLII